MCGIVGYIGDKDAYPILIKGLRRLEYRGYDSAGVAIIGKETKIYKKKGKVNDLDALVKENDVKGNIGIGHTRWATHGEPNDTNAHPHTSQNGKFTVIHNGIIENYSRLKKRLQDRDYKFKSQTDTEILANLIEYIYLKANGEIDAEQAVRLALSKVIGAYGIVIIAKDEPDKLIAARKGSPLVIGIGDGEYFIASDATPIVEHTNSVIYLNNDNVAVIKKNQLTLKTIANDKLEPRIQKLTMGIGSIEKNGNNNSFSKRIFKKPRLIQDLLEEQIVADF